MINAALAGFLRAACNAFSEVIGLAHGLEGALSESFIDLTHLDDKALDLLSRTPAAALGSSRYKMADADYEKIVYIFRQHDIHHLALIGGNGTMWMAQRLSEVATSRNIELHVVGIPKTIDNDLPCTDHTPGYGSAARFLALAVRDAGLDLEAMQTFDDVIILEAMGRDTGWLAAASTLMKQSEDEAPHLIYVPETPFDENQFLSDIVRVHQQLKRVFVVIAEGIRDLHGVPIGGENLTDALGRTLYSLSDGPAFYLARLTQEKLGLQTRCLRPNTIGRSSSACASEVDRVEAQMAGESAAQLLSNDQTGFMVTLERAAASPYRCITGTAPLIDVANDKVRTLPREFMDASGTMISDAFRDYALPLIGDIPPIIRLRQFGVQS